MEEIYYWKLRKWSVQHAFYAFVDTADYLADQLFITAKLRVWFDKEFVSPDSIYRVIFCKCKKKDVAMFEQALNKLPDKMLLCGHLDYLKFCDRLQQIIGAENNSSRQEPP